MFKGGWRLILSNEDISDKENLVCSGLVNLVSLMHSLYSIKRVDIGQTTYRYNVVAQTLPSLTDLTVKSDTMEVKGDTSSDSASESSSGSIGGSIVKAQEQKCQFCDYMSNRRSNLERHMLCMHTADCNQVLECCNQTFGNKAQLRDHRKCEHKDGYKCNLCARSFCRRALLKRHMSVHNGHKDFECTECTYASSHKSNLERHLIRVHGHTAKVSPMIQIKRDAITAGLDVGVEDSIARPRLCMLPYKCPRCLCSFHSQFEYAEHCKFCSNHDESTINAAIALAQLQHSPQFYDSAFIYKLEVSEYIEVSQASCSDL